MSARTTITTAAHALVGSLLLACASPSTMAAADHGADESAAESTTAGETTAIGESSTGAATELGPDDGSVTFYRDVLPIAQRRCIACHRDDNIAPFSLERYEDAWMWREAIVAAVTARTMPPWLPGADCNTYTNDPSLPADEAEVFAAWLAEQGPRGNPEDAPPPVDFGDGGLPRVDLTLASPEPYTPVGADDYRCFLLDWPLDAPAYVTGFHAKPGNPSIVHHVIAYNITPDRVAQYEALDAEDPAAGYTCFGGPGGAVTDPGAGMWLGAWAPGGGAAPYPEGTGLRMEPGAKVVLQVHYNTAAGGEGSDQTSIELMTDTAVEREAFMMLWADIEWLGGNMPIPKGDADVEHVWALDPTLVMDFLTDVVPPDQPFTIHSSSQHVHLLGTSARQDILRADGSSKCLVDIPRWDFGWQSAYRFADPVRFEPGDTLRLSCHWNNANGTHDVNWGEGTGDEMCLAIYYVTGI
jgi:Copper type II ascorbate-dependent monooxygenase, C-terminal domain